MEHTKIDLFDASVFASIRMLKDSDKRKKARAWFGG
jgi:phage terminase large subunit-like protein